MILWQDQPPVPAPVVPPSGPINPSPDQMTKLRGELSVVTGNVKVMGDMLTELDPSNVDSSDLELLQVMNLCINIIYQF